MSQEEIRPRSFNDLAVGDLVRIIRSPSGNSPRQINNSHAILGREYYIVRLSRNGASVSETFGGSPIFCGRVVLNNIGITNQPKLYIQYKKNGVKAKRMEYARG